MPISLRSWSVIALLSVGLPAAARDIPITIERCPSALSLRVPDEFSAAASAEHQAYRDAILNRLHENPGRKARYSEILITDWRLRSDMPQILVASLGTTLEAQGRMSESQWQELKRAALTSSKAQQEHWARQGLARLRPGMHADIQQVEGRVTRLVVGGPNDFTIFMNSTFTAAGSSQQVYTAAKFNYVKRCLAYIAVSVDASDDRALDTLTKIVERISVH
jgi:hypothetical protein